MFFMGLNLIINLEGGRMQRLFENSVLRRLFGSRTDERRLEKAA
jgi:hypothetical protein